jgi:hypothetical protein
MLYRVVHNDNVIGDLLPESELVYAFQCPVTVAPSNNDQDDNEYVDAVVLQAKKSENGLVVYTVMYGVDGRYSAYKEGIEASRIKYRHCATNQDVPSSGKKEPKNDEGEISAEANGESNKPPVSEVTCEPVAEESLDDGSRMTSLEQGSKDAGTASKSAETKISNIEQSHVAEGATNKYSSLELSHAANSMASSGLRRLDSMGSPSADAGLPNKRPNLSDNTKPSHPSFEITLPIWLQKDRESRLFLYCEFRLCTSHNIHPRSRPKCSSTHSSIHQLYAQLISMDLQTTHIINAFEKKLIATC